MCLPADKKFRVLMWSEMEGASKIGISFEIILPFNIAIEIHSQELKIVWIKWIMPFIRLSDPIRFFQFNNLKSLYYFHFP